MTKADLDLPDAFSRARSVVVVKPSSLGDVVHTLPAVHLLKSARPDLTVKWVVNTEWMPLLEDNPDLGGVIEFPRRALRGLSGGIRAWRWSRSLRGACGPGRPDLAIDFQGLLRSGWIARATRARRIVGLSDAREGARWFFTDVIDVDPAAHAIDRYLAVPAAFGVAVDPRRLEFPLPSGRLPPGVALPERFVVLHPYARGEGKALSPPQIDAFCKAMAPIPVVLVGVADRQAGTPNAGLAVDLTNRTSLTELIGVLRRAAFVVSVDSGPMHIATALDARVLGIHSWTDPRRVGPYAAGAFVWKAGRIIAPRELDDATALTVTPIPDRAIGQIAAFVREHLDGRDKAE